MAFTAIAIAGLIILRMAIWSLDSRGVLLAIVILSMAVPAAASGATATTIGQGHKPGVAVDAAGTAYIAWYGTENRSSLQFCRLPRGASACDATARIIAAPGTSLSRPFVVVSGTRVALVEYRYPQTGADPPPGVWEFISTDGGQSFDVGRRIGYPAFDEAVAGPGNTLSVATNASSEGLVYQNMPLDGGESLDPTRAVLSDDHPYNGTVGLVDAATPLVAFSDGASSTQFRRYDGSGSPNDAANWTPPVGIGYADYPRLAGGPSGLFMLAGTESGGIMVRKFDGTAFTPGVVISASGDDAQAHLFQDAGGRLHAVFPRGSAEGLHLVHAVSDDGVSWQSGIVLTQPGGVAIAALRVAAAPDHIGIAAWESGIDGTSEIRVSAIGPSAPQGTKPGLPPKGKPPAKAKRLKSGKVRVVFAGRLTLPGGVLATEACKGMMRSTLRRGKKRISKAAFKLNAKCRFGGRRILPKAKIGKARALKLTLAFDGNSALDSAQRTYLLKIK